MHDVMKELVIFPYTHPFIACEEEYLSSEEKDTKKYLVNKENDAMIFADKEKETEKICICREKELKGILDMFKK